MEDGGAVKTEDDMFRSVRTRRVSDLISQQLEAAIFSGRLKPGDRLPPERELVDRFEASRASVREAVRTLELAGLVAIRPGAGGGAYVTQPDFDLVANALRTMLRAGRFELTELYQARLLLEPGVAEIAARVADAEDIALLRASLQEGRDLLARRAQTAPASYNFHFLLAKASKSNLLLMLISSLMDLVHKSDQASGPRPHLSPPIVRAHEAIVDAVERHDAEEARRLTADHLLQIQQQVTKRIERLAS
ncbi:MAG TPA: FadR/GntR family transcriptional regulator [Chloroflexota bacterium]|jgi:DNA-binding FadR family transcriptional regulator|nr:FadR/GntR family transcriptional regulator [Chloroflexota bacterium]